MMKCYLIPVMLFLALSSALAQPPPLPDDLRGLVHTATYAQSGDGKTLKGLRIANIPIKDDALAVLKRYPSVRGLDLQLLPITGKGLNQIAQLTGLERLAIYKCFQLKDEDFTALTKLKALRVLAVSATEISDGGLKQICTLPNLEYLNIGDTKITQEGLSALKKCKKLKMLISWNPLLSLEFQKELETTIPGIKFGHAGDHPDILFSHEN